jgi:hypothetical protein
MRVEGQQLKAFLLDSGLVTKKEVEEAEKKIGKTDKRLGDVLVIEGKITYNETQSI